MICQEPVQCSNFDYVRLQKRLDQSSLPSAPTSKSSQQKVENFSTQQDLQIVPNHFDHEDEPSVLTATPCLPTKPPEKVLPEPKPETDSGNLTKPAPTHLLKGSVFFFGNAQIKKHHLEKNSMVTQSIKMERTSSKKRSYRVTQSVFLGFECVVHSIRGLS